MSIHDRLTHFLYSTVADHLKNTDRVTIAFSGGIDSSLLAKICQKLEKKVFLVTVGFPNSHDILFSKTISSLLSLSRNHIVYEMNGKDIVNNYKFVKTKMSCDILSHIENCIAFCQVAKIIQENNLGSLFLTANGFDELFCGYDRYRNYFSADGTVQLIMHYMETKLTNEFQLMDDISKITTVYGIDCRQPFLSKEFISFAKEIPVDLKIKGPDDLLRKHILREVALKIGVPEISAMHPKKALQYGSLLHKYIIKNRSLFGI